MNDPTLLPNPSAMRKTARMIENVYTDAPNRSDSARVQTTSAPRLHTMSDMASPRLLAFAQLLRIPNVFTAFADIALATCVGVAVTSGSADAPVNWSQWDEKPNLRRMLVDMVEEYARHTGHADLIRESIDGLVGEGLPPAPEGS